MTAENPTQPVPDEILQQLLELALRPYQEIRDSISGLTLEESRSWDEFVHGPGYDPDPLRRYVRSHGGHCSGGGGCS